MSEEPGTGEAAGAAKKKYWSVFGWTFFFRVWAAVMAFGGLAALAEHFGLTHSDRPGIIVSFALYLFAAVAFSALSGLAGKFGPRLVACAMIGWLSVDIFTKIWATALFAGAPLLLVILAASALKYPDPPAADGQK